MGLSDRFLVVGLGSPIVSDDAVGLVVAEKVREMGMPDVDVTLEAVGGLDIIPVLWGYRDVVIVDAIQTRQYEPGTVMIFDPEDFEPTIVSASAHDVNLATAMKIGRDMEPDMMPEQVVFVAIEAEDLLTVQEKLSPSVEAAVPKALDAVLHHLDEFRSQLGKR
ncbi:MAG: hydrogenase maturation protease [Thermoplasmatales archaeon]|nr:hydrogenase maturation protease [Thermoplasmatales archaeon]